MEGTFKDHLILEGHQPAGRSPKEGHQDDYGDEGALLQGKSEKIWFVQPGKKYSLGMT